MDILIKEATPIGMAKKIVVEVKLGRAERVSKRIRDEGLHFSRYGLEGINIKQPQSFDAPLSILK